MRVQIPTLLRPPDTKFCFYYNYRIDVLDEFVFKTEPTGRAVERIGTAILTWAEYVKRIHAHTRLTAIFPGLPR